MLRGLLVFVFVTYSVTLSNSVPTNLEQYPNAAWTEMDGIFGAVSLHPA